MTATAPSVNGNGVPHARLSAEHLADLRRSGLTVETIDAAGLYTERDAEIIGRQLNRKGPVHSLGPCLVFPFSADYVRFKPSTPFVKDGKARKYESPKGRPNRAYLPAGVREVAGDPAKPLFVTEGEKKSLKATQEGFPTVGLVGVYGWMKKREKDGNGKPIGPCELIPDLDAITWNGRQVYVVFDSDAVQNSQVRAAERSLAACLTSKGATVRIVRLPAASDGSKQGLDDYLVACGADELRKLIDASDVFEVGQVEIVEESDDPHRLARIEKLKHTDPAGRPLLRYWHSEWFRYRDGAYRRVPDDGIKNAFVSTIKSEFDRIAAAMAARAEKAKSETGNAKKVAPKKVKGGVVSDAMMALRSETYLSSSVQSPSWLYGDGPNPANLFVCRNAIVDLPSLVENKPDAVMSPTPALFVTNAADLDFTLKPSKPELWLKFLSEIFGDDKESPATLAEIMGYLLTCDTAQQKIFLFIGPPRAGKGVVSRITKKLIGEANCCNPTLGSLGTEFGLSPLLGKSLAIISDARLGGRSDMAIITERLLAISGEDGQDINRKFLPIAEGVKLPTRFLILSNELPRIADPSGALASRFIALRFRESFLGREDTQLEDKLTAELPSILWWAIDGWRRLRARGRFLQPASSKADVDELGDLSSPVRAFVRDRCKVDAQSKVNCSDLFDSWKSWCETQGRDKPGDAARFGRDLRAAVPTVQRSQKREGSIATWVYDGITVMPL